jgi:hypothetical protein
LTVANVLSLAMRISADASGFKLDPVQRALVGLGTEADKLTSVFDKFKGSSEAAGRAQEQVAGQFEELINTLRDGGSATQFAADFERLTAAAQEQAAVFAEGARVTEANRTAEERRATELDRLDRLLAQGAIEQETYNRAAAEASGANAAAAQAEKERLDSLAAAQRERDKLLQEGVRITQQFATEEQRRAQQIAELDALLDAAAISEETYARAKDQASGAASAAADAEAQYQAVLREGASLTEQYRTVEEKRAAELERIDKLLAQGAISEETASRAKAQASGASEVAARAERERADAIAAAARIIQANLTPQQRYDQQVQELTAHLQAGRIQQETFDRAVASATASFVKAESAAKGYDRAVEAAGDGGVLKFNELSGVLSALPGPLGSIAGRISGLSSAGEGLGRVFSGGLSQGLSGIGSSLAGLVNPLTVAVGGVAAFGAAAVAVARGLTQLEDRVENLGNIADKLGVSFGFIQTLDEAARRSGTSIDAVSAAFGRLQKSVLGVDEESKAAQKALAEIGVTAEELNALSPEEQYRKIGESLSSIEDPARRTAAATALFGRSGADLLPFFRNLDGAASDMERFGRALTEIDRQRIDDFGAGIDALGVATQGLGQSLLLPFAGLGEGVSKAFAEVTAGITAIVDPIGQVLEPVLTQIGRVLEIIGIGLGNVGRIIGVVFEPFATIAQEVSRALEPLYDGVVDIFRSLGDAQVAATEWLVSFTPVGAIADNVGVLGETISRIVTIITTAFSKAGELVGNLAGRFGELIAQSPLLRSIGETVSSVFGSVSGVFQTISNSIGGTVGRLLEMAERFLGIDRSAKDAAAGVDEVAAATEQVSQLGAKSQEALNKAIQQVGEYGQAGFDAALKYQEALREVDALIADEGLTEEQAARARAQVTAEYERQIDAVKQASDEKRKAADEAERLAKRESDAIQSIIEKTQEQIRIESDFGGDANRARNAADLTRVRDEIAKTEAELARANANSDTEAAARAAARLAQLDQVEAKLSEAEANFADRADETAQGFADGFDKAFQATTRGLDDLIGKAYDFGNEGAKAAQQLQDGVARAQQQVRDGILSKAAFEAEVANQRKLADERIAQLERERQAQQQAQQEAFQVRVNANERINAFLAEGVNRVAELQKQRDLEALKRQQTAAENVREIDQQIKARQDQLLEARKADDFRAALERGREIAALKERRNQEQRIVENKVKANQQINAGALASANAQAAQQQQFANAAQQQVGQLQRAANDAIGLTNDAFAKAAERQQKLFNDLNTLGSRTVETADARTAEGAAIVLGLATTAQDPRLIEQRLGNKIMREIAEGLATNLNRIGIPATLL